MSLVTLVSGGIDSTLMVVLAKEEGICQLPLFIDYGQICREQELNACIYVHEKLGLPHPAVMNLSGFGNLISSGLTDRNMKINEDAFLPGRNLLFLVAGSAYAYQQNCNAVAMLLVGLTATWRPDTVYANCADLNSLSIAITKQQEKTGIGRECYFFT
jgi:7-cyano-7-deazaguanine synthase